jgi:hypothetical protein
LCFAPYRFSLRSWVYYLPKISSDKDVKTAIIVSFFERIPMEELTGHRVFIRTAELSSITKAAESLGLTRAAASRALMSLESELGAALFTRTTARRAHRVWFPGAGYV